MSLLNESPENIWRDEILSLVLKAMASDEELNKALVFKGARILKHHLGRGRFSLDVDSSFSASFTQSHEDREYWRGFIESKVPTALRQYFSKMNPVRFELRGWNIERRPKKLHKLGWDGIKMKIKVEDLSKTGTSEIPSFEIEVTAPDNYDEKSIYRIQIEGVEVNAYSLERCVGEKFRAYLSSTSDHRLKMGMQSMALRVKDLYDIALCLQLRPLEDYEAFWKEVGTQFKLACKARYVDCHGLDTFQATWEQARKLYDKDASLNNSELILWDQVENSITKIGQFFEAIEIVPIIIPAPEV